MKILLLKIYRKFRDVKDSFFLALFRMFFKQEKAIIFDNFSGKGYGDSLKYIYLEVIKRKIDAKIYWVLDDNLYKNKPKDFPDNIHFVRYRSIQYLKAFALSKVWIRNSRMPIVLKKAKTQFYLNTMHSILPWKKVEFDVKRNKESSIPRMIILDNNNIDLMIASCEFKEKLLRESYRYTGKILRTVLPRCDCLYNISKEQINKLKIKYGIESEKKIVLYAPTFRDSKSTDVYSVDFASVLNSLSMKFGGDWIFIVRLHPSIMELSSIAIFNKNVIDGTSFGDAQEFLMISDVLITDYSSIMFDYMLTRRPIFLFATDYVEYIKERDFYYDFSSLPFTLCGNNKQLMDSIYKFDNDQYHENLEEYINKIGLYQNEKSSSEIVVDIISKELIKD